MGMGHGALGIGHWAWGIGHWAWERGQMTNDNCTDAINRVSNK